MTLEEAKPLVEILLMVEEMQDLTVRGLEDIEIKFDGPDLKAEIRKKLQSIDRIGFRIRDKLEDVFTKD